MSDIYELGSEFKLYGINVTTDEFVSVIRGSFKDTSKIDFDSMDLRELEDIVNFPYMFNLDTTFEGVLNLQLALERFDSIEYYTELFDIFDIIQANIDIGVKHGKQ